MGREQVEQAAGQQSNRAALYQQCIAAAVTLPEKYRTGAREGDE